MRISIFGLGCVGTVTAACLAAEGHSILGIDIDPLKLERLALGESPIIEEGLTRLIREGIQSGNLRVTGDHKYAIENSDAAMICVGTPGMADGRAGLNWTVPLSILSTTTEWVTVCE